MLEAPLPYRSPHYLHCLWSLGLPLLFPRALLLVLPVLHLVPIYRARDFPSNLLLNHISLFNLPVLLLLITPLTNLGDQNPSRGDESPNLGRNRSSPLKNL